MHWGITRAQMPRSLSARVVLGVAMLVGFVLRAYTVFTDDGIYWPDEIYQSFEPAHKAVFGYGVIPWEFITGARNWALPAIIAVILKITSLFGGGSPTVYIPVVKLVFVAASVASVAGVYRLSQVINRDAPTSELASAAAASLWALCAAALYFTPRATSENASAAAVIWGLALLLDANSSKRLLVLGASLLGLSVLFRLQSSVFCVGSVIILFARNKKAPEWKTALFVLAGWALALGIIDAIAWHDAPTARFGGLFHSAAEYVKFNLVEGKGSNWGTSSAEYYARYLWATMPAVTALLALGLIFSFREARGLGLIVVAYLVLHVAVAHKELRFMVPVLPVLCALVGPALMQLAKIPALKLALPATVLVAALSAWSAPSLTMGDLGAYLERPKSSAWNDFGNVNRLMLVASKRDDVCGMRIDIHLAWTGGSTYFHHPVPLYMPGYPPNSGHFNYAIIGQGQASGAEVVAQDNGLALVRLPGVQCVPDPGYSWRLP